MPGMIDYAIETGFGEDGRSVPAGPDLKTLADLTREVPERVSPPSRRCPSCRGEGQVFVDRTQTSGIFAGHTYSFAERCACTKPSAA
jgi:hypothetical protein